MNPAVVSILPILSSKPTFIPLSYFPFALLRLCCCSLRQTTHSYIYHTTQIKILSSSFRSEKVAGGSTGQRLCLIADGLLPVPAASCLGRIDQRDCFPEILLLHPKHVAPPLLRFAFACRLDFPARGSCCKLKYLNI